MLFLHLFGRNRRNVLEACFVCDACHYLHLLLCPSCICSYFCNSCWSVVESRKYSQLKLHGVATLHKVKSSWECFRGPFCAFWFQTQSTAWLSVSFVHVLVGVQAYCKRMEGQSKWNNATMLCPIMPSGFHHWDIVCFSVVVNLSLMILIFSSNFDAWFLRLGHHVDDPDFFDALEHEDSRRNIARPWLP